MIYVAYRIHRQLSTASMITDQIKKMISFNLFVHVLEPPKGELFSICIFQELPLMTRNFYFWIFLERYYH